jgi:hypothetical protein
MLPVDSILKSFALGPKQIIHQHPVERSHLHAVVTIAILRAKAFHAELRFSCNVRTAPEASAQQPFAPIHPSTHDDPAVNLLRIIIQLPLKQIEVTNHSAPPSGSCAVRMMARTASLSGLGNVSQAPITSDMPGSLDGLEGRGVQSGVHDVALPLSLLGEAQGSNPTPSTISSRTVQNSVF